MTTKIKIGFLVVALIAVLATATNVLAAPLYGAVNCNLHPPAPGEICGCNGDDAPGYYCVGGSVYWYNQNCSIWNDPLNCPSGVCHCAADGYADHCQEHCR